MQIFKKSLAELRSIRCLCVLGMLGALVIVLESMSLNVGEFLKFELSNICTLFVCYLFGPAVGGIFCGAMDLLIFFLIPKGGYIPGLTFNAVLTGVILGTVLYQKPMTIQKPLSFARVLIGNFFNSMAVNVLLGTFWLTQTYGAPYIAWLPGRFIQNLIMSPIQALIFILVFIPLKKGGVFQIVRQPAASAAKSKQNKTYL